MQITSDNIDELLDTSRLEVHLASGEWLPIRRAGPTSRWPGGLHLIFAYGDSFRGSLSAKDFPLRPEHFRIKP